MRFVGILKRLVGLALLAAVTLAGWKLAREQPQDLPWTSLDLRRPAGLFTGRKIVRLRDKPARCRALLAPAGIEDRAAPPVNGPGVCGYADGERLEKAGARTIAYHPGVTVSCPVDAALLLWERDVLQPAAMRLFGSRVVRIDDYGSYNCRRINGREGGPWSEHATADAIDIAGFRLADGMRISVAANWSGKDRKAVFLHQARNGACPLFATVLSPDYNALHHDHLHLDQAERGAFGWRACR